MIAPVPLSANSRLHDDSKPVEIRLVVEIRMPEWMQPPRPAQSPEPPQPKESPSVQTLTHHFSDLPVEIVPEITTTRIHQPESQQASGLAAKSLEELYDHFCLPVDLEEGVTPRWSRTNKTALRQFEAWFNTRSTIPRVQPSKMLEIPGILDEYAAHLRSQTKGASASMCVKKLSAIGKLSTYLVQAGLIRVKPTKPKASKINTLKPRTEKQRRTKGVPVTLEELASMRAVLSECVYPEIGSISPARYWDICLVSHMVYGFRSQDWFATRTREKKGLLWSGVITDPQCPVIPELLNEAGWIWYLVHKTKRKNEQADKPVDVLIPMSKWMRQAIEEFRGLDSERVFPTESNSHYFSREFNGILSRAGLSDLEREQAGKPPIRLSLGQSNVASFRKGCAAMWKRHLSPAAASYFLHHSDGSGAAKMTAEHYLQHEDVLRDITPAIESLPLW